MNEKKILAGNKLISEFLGAKIIKGKGVQKGNLYAEYRDERGNYNGQANLKHLTYHSDWNTLIAVWFKFQQTLDNHEERTCKAYLSQLQKTFCIGICEEESIETCYQALIEGLKWFNKQKF